MYPNPPGPRLEFLGKLAPWCWNWTVRRVIEPFPAGPERLILDLPDAQLLATLSELPLDGPVRAIRSGQLGGGGTRIVPDLRQAVRPRSFALEPQAGKGHRLVLDLYPQALAAPRADAGAGPPATLDGPRHPRGGRCRPWRQGPRRGR